MSRAELLHRLRIGARLGAPVDGSDHDAVAVIVQERGGEGEAAAHVVEGIVADDVESLEGITRRLALRLLCDVQAVDAPGEGLDPFYPAPDDADYVLVAVFTSKDHVTPAQGADPPEQDHHEDQSRQRDQRDDCKDKGELVGGEVRHDAASYTFAMRPEEVKALLTDMRAGKASIDDTLRALRHIPVDNLGFAQLDTHRELRQGMVEAIYAEGKTAEQVVAIAARMMERTRGPVIVTRVSHETASALGDEFPDAVHHERARLVVLRAEKRPALGSVAVVTAGTSDLAVADEAALTAEALGATAERITDVGVAGLHRILAVQDRLHAADVVIVVAGMEGALASLVGGITESPVIAVPTSVGYGASFEGLAALLAMLNSCAAGVAVMNIDNGFGAAAFALRLLRKKRGDR